MGLFGNLFGNKKTDPVNFGDLKVDVHSHLIPGIDDGAPDMEASMEMLAQFENLGYQKVITTPHVMADFYKNTSAIITEGLQDVRKELQKSDLNIKIDAAAEYNLDENFFKLIEAKDLLTFGENYVLFELSFNAEPPQVNEAIFSLITAGYTPILAHVERYHYYHSDWEKIEDLKRRGALLQLNMNSLSGHYGKPTRKMAEQLIEKDHIALLGSDCHRIDHLRMMNDQKDNYYLSKAFELDLINRELV